VRFGVDLDATELPPAAHLTEEPELGDGHR
jgi:hypothetical protein